MGLKAGIVGLPNVGKSTLFSALTKVVAESANYPFTTINPNRALVELADKRLEELAKIAKPQKIVPATFEFVDIAGLVEGASKGEGRGNQFLNDIRGVDLIVEVVRCFEDPNIIHTQNSLNPIRDIQLINLELILSDLQLIEKLLERKNKLVETQERPILEKLKTILEKERLLSQENLDDQEKKIAKKFQLLTIKPFIFVANLTEEELLKEDKSQLFLELKDYCGSNHFPLLALSAILETQLLEFSDQEQQDFLKSLNQEYTSLQQLARRAFELLNLATFFSVGQKEVRAWVFKKGSKAQRAAKVIHTDFEKNFIRAKVIDYQDFVSLGGQKNAQEAGRLRVEGKEYLVKDGDIIEFLVGK